MGAQNFNTVLFIALAHLRHKLLFEFFAAAVAGWAIRKIAGSS